MVALNELGRSLLFELPAYDAEQDRHAGQAWLTPEVIMRTNVEMLCRYIEKASPFALKTLAEHMMPAGWDVKIANVWPKLDGILEMHRRIVNEFWRVLQTSAMQMAGEIHRNLIKDATVVTTGSCGDACGIAPSQD